MPALFQGAAVGAPWQTRALSLKIIASFADHAPVQLGSSLPEVKIHFSFYFTLFCLFNLDIYIYLGYSTSYHFNV